MLAPQLLGALERQWECLEWGLVPILLCASLKILDQFSQLKFLLYAVLLSVLLELYIQET
ncbi:MAG: hypothetical protein EBQ89_06930 [Alphaproteobacteria bacterium]|nr:hypothetical protein [Alphaproteobacteria bacterium]NDG03686.1 hypothetical protein [Synechococcaceae bacterium WBB_34_004]